MKKLPDFIVAGAPKCGTTSLHYYLNQHPDIFLSLQKELHYFSSEMLQRRCSGPGDLDALKLVAGSKEEYASHFYSSQESQVLGDISPSYFYFGRECAEKIKTDLPDIKIIIMLRNPIQKTYSQYMHQVRDGYEKVAFGRAIGLEEERSQLNWSNFWMYAGSSRYAKSLRAYIDVFGRNQVKVIFFEDFILQKKKILNDICNYIGVAEWEWDVSRHLNKSGVPRSRFVKAFLSDPPDILISLLKRVISKPLRHRLKDCLASINLKGKPVLEESVFDELAAFFLEDVRELEELLKVKVPWEGFH